MNKQRFSVLYEEFTSDIIPKGIMDNKKNNHMCRIEEVCSLLNEQQATINRLETELKCYKGIIEALERTRVIEVEIPTDKMRDSKMVIDDE